SERFHHVSRFHRQREAVFENGQLLSYKPVTRRAAPGRVHRNPVPAPKRALHRRLARVPKSKTTAGGRSPLLVRRGGRDSKKMPRSLLVGADGVVAHTGM